MAEWLYFSFSVVVGMLLAISVLALVSGLYHYVAYKCGVEPSALSVGLGDIVAYFFLLWLIIGIVSGNPAVGTFMRALLNPMGQ